MTEYLDFFFFLTVLAFEFRVLCLLFKHATTCTSSCSSYFGYGGPLNYLPGVTSNLLISAS
jgi:hypothetical protein